MNISIFLRHYLLISGLAHASFAAAASTDWPEYLGGPERSQYSALSQINHGNVTQLQVAWQYRTGDPGEMQCNPIVISGTLYGVSAAGSVFALDGATGRERWRFPRRGAEEEDFPSQPGNRILRGLTYWSDGSESRILYTAGSWLVALNAETGELVLNFGTNGRASLRTGLGDAATGKFVTSTSPGTLFEDLLIMPLRVAEAANAAPGHIQAFNVRTGDLAWTFHTLPKPGEFGYETWPSEAYQNSDIGGANSWAGMAIDRERGIVYVPTGSAAPDFWGGRRHGENLFANCLLALDARTGQRLWHFQFVRHDLWDRDLPAPPTLTTVRHEGGMVDAVAQTTKSGHVFVFDRVTGKSLFPIEEKAVPASPVPGEQTWPTQPVPLKPDPFARQSLGVEDISPFAENREELVARFESARIGTFVPFGLEYETVHFPGFDGGAEWGGAAVDPSGVLYVNSIEMAWIAKLREVPEQDQLSHLSSGERVYTTYCAACHGEDRKGRIEANLPSLLDVSDRLSRAELASLIRGGKGMMPGFPGLSENELQSVSDFLLGTEKSESAPRNATPVVPGPSTVEHVPYRLDGYNRFLDSKGYPAIAPPWGTLTAIDLNTGEHRWQVPLGEEKELASQGIAATGTENYGGPVVTAGGLLFIAATKDGMFRAFDKRTGDLLWETELPAPGFATPSCYEADGRQFIVVATGGTKLGTRQSDHYVAFALPTDGE